MKAAVIVQGLAAFASASACARIRARAAGCGKRRQRADRAVTTLPEVCAARVDANQLETKRSNLKVSVARNSKQSAPMGRSALADDKDASYKHVCVDWALECGWIDLETREPVALDVNLAMGQTFRWTRLEDGIWAGTVGSSAVVLREDSKGRICYKSVRGNDVQAFDAVLHARLRDYFHLDVKMMPLISVFCFADSHFASVAPSFHGVRLLNTDPTECFFSFICSSNNNIKRISSMVHFLAETYTKTPITTLALTEACSPESKAEPKSESVLGDAVAELSVEPRRRFVSLWRFPTVQEIAENATEELLRDNDVAKFGYRAKFVVEAARQLQTLGGEEWLESLKTNDRVEVSDALIQLPGVGRKVAACIALLSLRQHDEIPVDTHVWQFTQKHYLPQLRGKSLTDRVFASIGDHYRKLFGPYAGWAHNLLFAADLREFRHRLEPRPNTKRHSDDVGASDKKVGLGHSKPSTPKTLCKEEQTKVEPTEVSTSFAELSGTVKDESRKLLNSTKLKTRKVQKRKGGKVFTKLAPEGQGSNAMGLRARKQRHVE